MLLSEVKEELAPPVLTVLGFNDKLRGVSDAPSEAPELYEIPEGLPFVEGNFITSTRSSEGVEGGVIS